MRIDDAIKQLQVIKEMHGNLDLFGHQHNAQCLSPLNHFLVKSDSTDSELYVELDCDWIY